MLEKKHFLYCSLLLVFIEAGGILKPIVMEKLYRQYKRCCLHPSDINEHLPLLRRLSTECKTVVEIGVRDMVATWAILQGLSENGNVDCSYLGIDLALPPAKNLKTAKCIAQAQGITFEFIKANDMSIDLKVCDMLFIDSLHTYCHLTYELETFSSKVSKYIAMHDTSAPWGNIDDTEYHGDYSEYPEHFNKTKRGLWPAVIDFLSRHPEWILQEHKHNNNGFTVLKRIK